MEILSPDTIRKQNQSGFLKRFLIYQKERFPFVGHGLLIAAFTFSAVAYSRMCRGVEGFIAWKEYGWGVFITVTLFLLLRISDEFKDKEDDAKYRKYLPVPRGLIRLKELLVIAVIVLLLQLLVIFLVFPSLIWLYIPVLIYLFLMRVEFWVPQWLKARPVIYMVSHMFIMPLIDIFASGLDWMLNDADAPKGLMFFFGVSYMNGIVMEMGRKMKSRENEEEGVVSYTGLWGVKRAPWIWISMLFINAALAVTAAWFAGHGVAAFAVLGFLFIIFALPAFLFYKSQKQKFAKGIEYAAILWTLLMYFILGAIPMINDLLF